MEYSLSTDLNKLEMCRDTNSNTNFHLIFHDNIYNFIKLRIFIKKQSIGEIRVRRTYVI